MNCTTAQALSPPATVGATSAMLRPRMLAPGTTYHRYRIETLLGTGGVGEVYRAYDPTLQRHIALKVVRAEHAASRPPWSTVPAYLNARALSNRA
jgi:serine/threonine protein kinase